VPCDGGDDYDTDTPRCEDWCAEEEGDVDDPKCSWAECQTCRGVVPCDEGQVYDGEFEFAAPAALTGHVAIVDGDFPKSGPLRVSEAAVLTTGEVLQDAD
jgi:hypothetical protein